MTIESPIAWHIIKPALARWLSHVTGLVVVWEKQNMPQPAKPYATLNISSGPRRVNHDWVERTYNLATENIERKVVGVREFTVTAQAFSDNPLPGLDAMHYMSAAQSSLEAPSTKKHFRDNAMRCDLAGQVVDLSDIVSGKYQTRAAFDMTVRATSNYRDTDITPIDSAIVSIEFYTPGETETPAFTIESEADSSGE